jgi:hypothetical protein
MDVGRDRRQRIKKILSDALDEFSKDLADPKEEPPDATRRPVRRVAPNAQVVVRGSNNTVVIVRGYGPSFPPCAG